MKQIRLILTCEHAGNFIPQKYQDLFRNHAQVLQTHRGWDPGAFPLVQRLKKRLGCSLMATETSRLLIDVNRSLWRKTLFSELTRNLEPQLKEEILKR